MLKAEGLEYEVHGDGEAVLLIHGSHIADAFLPLVREPALADRYRLIRYRRRGFAGSDPHSGPFSIEEQARDALALMKHLGLERAHVVGHSYGGTTAVQLAIEAPSLVHSLVLLEPGIVPAETASAVKEMWAPALEAYGSGDARGAIDAFMNVVGGPEWRTEVEKTVPGGPEQAEADAATYFDVEAPALEQWTFDRDGASHIAQPILYVIGGETLPVVEVLQQHFQSLVPHTERALVPGVNHSMQMQDPKAVAATIADFLSRHPF
jgi:pimeloyl-ACP methyl ester carboxylesterase